MFDAQELADQSVAVRNKADAERRRQQIAAPVPEGQHHRDVHGALGYAALEQRIGSCNKNVRDGGHRFGAAKHARPLHDIAISRGEMPDATEARAAAHGFDVLRAEGRILVDYQFII